ncbi:MAG: gluconate 2-dehydrogenase subunit 3 family protein [gamma proteobacterium symbiont of Bathyaustriella thionipta]|nr:gluconate 2-dehydrogenase subunit 3 family protein [gamma proteobacterium symbiont of Bathyaustriella thionipta]MCU7949951.1 gluconate 2-dehydrogenase subunit 3 family protein [gamma proteobacterium symbiont of Bathyaustriella thionipta]MCU7954693.1 gluconate 2-dehydrogenase subunit 3 family protein [gamma proteobacterium symbiont of Bathyaustriella thionipta]MCU7956516.1 gluconate 2-dehydrogenase subunit 3 family protein [gamma proteobacterium symbiont of Bathyaustriella thionipta]MCU796683
MDRRTFILRGGSTIAAAAKPLLSPVTASAVVNTETLTPAVHSVQTISEQLTKQYTKADWLTIATVQNHLFPSEAHAPGAIEINALQYLHDYLSNPATDPVDIEFILSGTRLLQSFAKKESHNGLISFTDLSIEQREVTLRKFEKQADEGSRWLITLLNYVLEALLTDPVYGGNPDGIGWQWLEHRAGEPHPPMNKRYWLL